MTRAQEKKKESSSKAASIASAPSASRNAPLSDKKKRKAEQAFIKQNIEKSIEALAKEAIPVSATPTRLEDEGKKLTIVMATAKKMQAAHRKELAEQLAAQAAADAQEPSDQDLLGISPEDVKGDTEPTLDSRGYVIDRGGKSELNPRVKDVFAEDDLDNDTVEAEADTEPETDAEGEAEAEDDDNPPADDDEGENKAKVNDTNDGGAGGGSPDSSSDESDENDDDENDEDDEEEDGENDDDDDDDEAESEVEVEEEVEEEPEEPPAKPTKKKALKIKPLAKKKATKTDPTPAKKVPKGAKAPAKADSKSGKPSRTQKAEHSDSDSPPQHKQGLQTSIINMKEAYYLRRQNLLSDADKAARAFYEQAYRPGMETRWDMLIEADAVQTIRDQLLRCRSETGYSVKTSLGWPKIDGKWLTLKQIANDLKKIFYNNKRTTSHFDFEMKLKNCPFKISWRDPSVEDEALAEFRDIILGFWTSYDNIDADIQNDICKAFYKKLPKNNKFTDNFMAKTKQKTKGTKKDTIVKMLTRLVVMLGEARQMIKDAEDMGGLDFVFESKLTLTDQEDSEVAPHRDNHSANNYKAITKRQVDPESSGLSRATNFCHTCGKKGHNRYECPNFMNPHCNRTQCTWSQSEECKEFKRIGHEHFVPNVYIGANLTHDTNFPGAATYVYPTEDVENDFSPPGRIQDNRPPKKQKQAHFNNSKYNNRNDQKGDRNNRDDRDTNDRSNTNKLSSNYKGKSKSNPTATHIELIEESRNLPMMQQLLSAILPENIDDFLQVHISLLQIPSPTSNPVATALTIVKTTHATRRTKRRTVGTTAPDPSPPPPPQTSTSQNRGMDALAQIDTGCQVGDVINGRVLRGLRGDNHLRKADLPMWMCSGLNNQCVESTTVLDIVVSFNKDNLKHTFGLPVRIAQDSEVDLILGLQTIKNLI